VAESVIDPGAPFHAVCDWTIKGFGVTRRCASRTGRDLLAPDAPGVAKNRRRRIFAKGRLLRRDLLPQLDSVDRAKVRDTRHEKPGAVPLTIKQGPLAVSVGS